MLGDGGSQKEALRPNFDRSIMIDFRGAKISSNSGFLLLREMDERFDIIGPMSGCLEDRRSPVHTRYSLVQMIRQRVYQISAGYEDCNDADHLRIDPALRLAIGKGHKMGASQSMLSRLENEVLGGETGLKALDAALRRPVDALLKDRRRLIIDVDSTEDPAHGSQERVAYNGHFGLSCFHPCLPSRAAVPAWERSSGRATCTRPMEPSLFSTPSWGGTVPGSGFFGFGAAPPSRARTSTSTARESGSPTSSAFAPTRSSTKRFRLIWHARLAARPGMGVRSRWSISITKQRAERGPAGWSVRWNGVRIS